MKMKLLVVESDGSYANRTRDVWTRYQVELVPASTMEEGIDLLTNETFIAIYINTDNVGFRPLLRTMREMTDIPIHILASKKSQADSIDSYYLGADMYVVLDEEIELGVLRAFAQFERFRQRNKQPKPTGEILKYRGLRLCPDDWCVTVQDVEICLCKKEFDLLYYLLVNRGRILTYSQIIDYLWGQVYDDGGSFDALGAHIQRLRKILYSYPCLDGCIKNKREVGYYLCPE